jgi:hypothetical protein
MAHEMIHLFIHDSHGPHFISTMNKINRYLGFEFIHRRQVKGTVYLSFVNALEKEKECK